MGASNDCNTWGYDQKEQDSVRNYVERDTRYVAMVGEIAYASTMNLWPSAKHDFIRFHYTAFTDDPYAHNITAQWHSSGGWDTIAKSLGYRFRLIKSSLPSTLSPGGPFNMSMEMANDGWARIINPRKVEIIFRNTSTGALYMIDIDGDGKGNRLWLPGPGENKVLNISKTMPADIPSGTYELLLNLPDPYLSLHDRPEYSIRLANQNTWEEKTGFNSLLHQITIK